MPVTFAIKEANYVYNVIMNKIKAYIVINNNKAHLPG